MDYTITRNDGKVCYNTYSSVMVTYIHYNDDDFHLDTIETNDAAIMCTMWAPQKKNGALKKAPECFRALF